MRRVGQNCLIGAATLVTGGVKIPDRSLVVGVPGRVQRELTDKEVAWIVGMWQANGCAVGPGDLAMH